MSAAPRSAQLPWRVDFTVLAALWGASFMFMRLGVHEFGALGTAFVRVFIAALFLLAILLVQGKFQELRRHARPVLLIGMVNSGIPFACFAFAVLHISTGLSAILNATVPLFGALIAWAWLNDRLRPAQVLGLFIGFAGVAALAWDETRLKPEGSLWAVAACLLATVCYGLAGCWTKRYLGGIPPLVTAAGSQIGAALGLVLPALWFWPGQMPSATAWAALLALGVLCTGVAYILYFRIIANAGPSKAFAVTFMIPVFAVFYGTVLLGETLTLWMLLCGAVIVFGTTLSTGLLGKLRAPP